MNYLQDLYSILTQVHTFEIGKKMPVKSTITFQVLNLFDTDYLAAADRFGVFPGIKRTYRANLSIGL